MEHYSDDYIGICDYCHQEIYSYEKYRIHNGKLYHNDDANNCYKQSQTFIDDFGDNILNEE